MPVWALALPLLLLGPSAEAQSFGDRLRSAVERTVEREVERRVVRETENITRCLMNDERCIDEARARGDDVEIVNPASTGPRRGETFGGVEFPQGEISFADEVVSYTPGSPAPTAPHRNAQAALGRPQYDGRATCTSATDCTTLSLGSGGQLVVRFTDNVLTGSGDGEIDLWVFEVGPDVEDMAVEISTDGTTWHSVGAIGGGRSGVDIDAFGFGPGSAFTHVRLTDDPNRGGRSGATPGADIDAVGAISTRPARSEECICAPSTSGYGDVRSETIGGVVFPQGEISFADEAVSYTPGSPAPTAPHRNAQAALGRPQYDGRATCTSAADCTTLSLGSGGQLVVRFTDNVLTGSGDGEIDLWVFEVGPDVEDMAVEVSADGTTWHSVGAIGGGRSGVDIDAFGFGPGSAFTHVRLTDDPNRGGRSGATPGADIDAVGAISTRATGSSGCGC